MASVLLGTLKSLGTSLLGDLFKEGVETLGNVAKSKIRAFEKDQSTPLNIK